MGTGIILKDSRNRAGITERRFPGYGRYGISQQTTFFPLPAPIIVAIEI